MNRSVDKESTHRHCVFFKDPCIIRARSDAYDASGHTYYLILNETPMSQDVKLIALDIDGTLVLTDDIYFEAFKRLLEPYG